MADDAGWGAGMKGYGPIFFLAEAWRGLRKNGLMNLLAIGTISMAVLMAAALLLFYLNVRSVVNTLGNRFEMSIYLRNELTQDERDVLLKRLQAEPGVRKATFLSKDEALRLFAQEMKGQEMLLQGLGENPLPDSFELSIDRAYADAARLELMARRYASWTGVEDVSYGKQGIDVLTTLFRIIAYGGGAIGLLLCLSIMFIVSNSVRLALYARGQEIELMQWIGATRWFIRLPFLIEGMLIALFGASLAIAGLALLWYAVPPAAAIIVARPNGLDFLPPSVVACLIGGSGLLGLIGGSISVRKFVK